MEFIRRERGAGCVFCRLPAEREKLRDNLIVHLGKACFVILNRYPYTCGHLMVVPRRHTSDYLSLTDKENAETTRFLQTSLGILTKTYGPEGFNMGVNLGHAAGAGIREHLHHHLIPRWVGDSNFLPVIGKTRSLPELLIETYDRLRPHFRRLEASGELPRGGHDETEGDDQTDPRAERSDA